MDGTKKTNSSPNLFYKTSVQYKKRTEFIEFNLVGNCPITNKTNIISNLYLYYSYYNNS